jgi:hypothetical protein
MSQTEATNHEPAKRSGRWHVSTWIIIALLVAFVFLANFPARKEKFLREASKFTYDFKVLEHGWPLTYRTQLEAPFIQPNLWSLDASDSIWRVDLLLLDLVFAGITGWAIAYFWERRLRLRRSIWRFSLREALAMFAMAAIIAGWLANEFRYRRSIESQFRILENKGGRGDVTFTPRVPEWLFRLVGTDNWSWFPLIDVSPGENAEPTFLYMDGSYPRGETVLKLIAEKPELFGMGLICASQDPEFVRDERNRQVALISGSPRLMHLQLDGWSTEVFKAILRCDNLTTLDAEGSYEPMTAAELKGLSRCPRLTTLALPHGDMTDDALDELAALQQLEHLELSDCSLSPEGWKKIAQLKHLQTLSLHDCNESDEDLALISLLPSLQRLALENSQVTDSGLSALQNCHNLWYFDLKGADIGTAGLRNLQKLPRLWRLDINGTSISDDSLAALSGFPNLAWVDIGFTYVRHPERLDFAALPRLRGISASECQISQRSLALFAKQAPGVEIFNRGFLGAPRPPPTIYNAQAFAKLIYRDWAMLFDPEVTDDVLRDFIEWVRKDQIVVRRLSLHRANITDEVLIALRDLPDLAELDLSDTEVTATGIAQLQLPSLKSITLDPRQLNDRSATSLSRLPHLESVLIDYSARERAARKAADRFKEILPQLRLFFPPVVG